ncbi:hypothetical protein GC087_06625 [Pantoea sp. JZ2]|uniref:hypothetical protein n=1 Tax=Pantoea sp. JZ2 TaxID=2654189 RepID=UPI002B4799F9|nr:hypothetical protein [Pantoea sp. JZ2]WRH12309.1 hypothetical protein GC087_06625 [Pantoea sp. JZ2]
MKMTDKELKDFQEASEANYGVEVFLTLVEEYPSQLNDEQIIAIAGTLKRIISGVNNFMASELHNHGVGRMG